MSYCFSTWIAPLCAAVVFGCSAPALRLSPPFSARLEAGDAIKITTKDRATVHGRILDMDSKGITLRVARRTTKAYPYEVDSFAERLGWQDIETLDTRALLDPRGKLVTEQEIRENMLWRDRLNWMITAALFGAGGGLYASSEQGDDATSIQFWSRPTVGATAGAVFGYLIGRRADRNRAIRRILRTRQVEEQCRP